MKIDFYKLLVRMANRFGSWIFVVVAKVIAAGYFVLPGRTRESRRLYALLFPERSRLFHLWCTFRQFQNFTSIHIDRYLANQGREIEVLSEGMEQLDAVIDGSGAILLMSHFGNWEMAARLLMQKRRNLRLLLYMGVKEKEGVERTQKEELRSAGVRIIGVDRKASSPFVAVDGVKLLKEGGIVSMTGDIVWRDEQRCLEVDFLGGVAFLPEAPFVFALVSGSPIYVFFAFRSGKNSYRLSLSSPIQVRATSRQERKKAITEAAQHYADLLEEALRTRPLEWYHFDRFVHFPASDEPERRPAV